MKLEEGTYNSGLEQNSSKYVKCDAISALHKSLKICFVTMCSKWAKRDVILAVNKNFDNMFWNKWVSGIGERG